MPRVGNRVGTISYVLFISHGRLFSLTSFSLIHGCSGVWVFGCSSVRMFECSGVRVFECVLIKVFNRKWGYVARQILLNKTLRKRRANETIIYNKF